VRAAELIAAGGVLLRPPCGSFEDAVRGLVDTLIDNTQLAADVRERAIQAVVGREAVASTAIVEIGVSVPHARLEGVDGVVAALAASPTALYYAMAGVPISVMVIVLSAPELVGEHLNTLASVSLLLQSAALRRGLEQAADSAGALHLLRGGNGRY
jgi:mannitol/fructose-specific phosphotransferase system IIA component (Ntr-type)